MRINPKSNLGVALAILRKIKMREKDVSISTYSNCREQGFFVTSYLNIKLPYNDMRAVSFAENRNSDDIIVQYGVKGDFNDYGVIIDEQTYRERKKFFRFDHTDEAAKFITAWLTYKSK